MSSRESENGLSGFVRSVDSLASLGNHVGRKVIKAGITNASQQLKHNISDIREETPFMPYEPGAKGQDKLTATIEDVKVRVEAVRRLNLRSLVKDIRIAALEGRTGT